MMERYEIADHRPATLRAVFFGADQLMLGVAARLLDQANEHCGDLGALCVTPAAEALMAQDGMFTLLVRGDNPDGSHTCREQVVQSIISALNPETEFDQLLKHAADTHIEMLFLPLNCSAVELALCARFLYARFEAGLGMPLVILPGVHPRPDSRDDVHAAVAALASSWAKAEEFALWLKKDCFRAMLSESLSGPLSASESAKARHDMNYRDDFIAWAEPMLRCTLQGKVPEMLGGLCADSDFDAACLQKARVFDSVVFLCAAAGYLSGMDTFAQTLKDEKLRAWIGRAFFDEILPGLPYRREEIAPEIISVFSRLENSMNDMPLMEIGRGLLGSLNQTLLPAIRAYAEREFEAPRRLSLALSAAIMIYAGARRNDKGAYEIQRGEHVQVIHDDPELLEDFSSLSHDMPAESLAYAVLANRAAWGSDLREIDGLEMRVMFNLSSIQRIGWRETMKIQEEE